MQIKSGLISTYTSTVVPLPSSSQSTTSPVQFSSVYIQLDSQQLCGGGRLFKSWFHRWWWWWWWWLWVVWLGSDSQMDVNLWCWWVIRGGGGVEWVANWEKGFLFVGCCWGWVLELGGTEGAEPQDGRVYTVYIQHNGSPNRDLSARTTAIEATVIYISNCGKSP